jgi:hypothetical protein
LSRKCPCRPWALTNLAYDSVYNLCLRSARKHFLPWFEMYYSLPRSKTCIFLQGRYLNNVFQNHCYPTFCKAESPTDWTKSVAGDIIFCRHFPLNLLIRLSVFLIRKFYFRLLRTDGLPHSTFRSTDKPNPSTIS